LQLLLQAVEVERKGRVMPKPRYRQGQCNYTAGPQGGPGKGGYGAEMS
jgi:hypothetical protein